mmetsp:Transcript_35248/g.77202  ORF Transcript_35248/g.77202 Transcript_35248/m.77202 type:complete len:111 (+) Transcript_35248:2514-2846(+)
MLRLLAERDWSTIQRHRRAVLLELGPADAKADTNSLLAHLLVFVKAISRLVVPTARSSSAAAVLLIKERRLFEGVGTQQEASAYMYAGLLRLRLRIALRRMPRGFATMYR